MYHLQREKVPAHIEARLIHRTEHSPAILKIKLEEYNNFLPKVETEYQRQLIRVNAEEAFDRVFANMCEAIEKPVA